GGACPHRSADRPLYGDADPGPDHRFADCGRLACGYACDRGGGCDHAGPACAGKHALSYFRSGERGRVRAAGYRWYRLHRVAARLVGVRDCHRRGRSLGGCGGCGMSVPGLLIAAPRSGSGKTTVTLGLMRALARRGLRVRGAKCGPDYIDPAFHVAATGRPSVNLDSWAMPPELLTVLLSEIGTDCDLGGAEALMGLFDGVENCAPGRSGSSADVAALAGWPVVLVLDVSGQSQSAGAVAAGFARFDPRIRIAGVVLNKVGSE